MNSKKLIGTYLVCILIASIFSSISGTGGIPSVEASGFEPLFSGGDGTAGNPYKISTVTELQWMGNTSNLNKHFILVNDINASATKMWNSGAGFVPVGTSKNKFTGSLDGKGYNITSLFIKRSGTDYQGLFGYIGTGGAISNVGLIDNNVIGYLYVGGLVGYCYYGALSYIYATGTVSGNWDVGGLVGYNGKGTVSHCYVLGSVSGTYFIGGLVGENYYSTVVNCSTTVTVSGTGINVGGLVGSNIYGNVYRCYATGNVSGTMIRIGGLVGSDWGTLSNSYYNVEKVWINDGHHLTIGALYDTQYQDWFSNDMTLNIKDYIATLVPSGEYYCISTAQGLRDLLGFANIKSYKFRLATDIDLSNAKGLYIPYFSASEFDGNNNTISNLLINMSFGVYVGMFGYVASSVEIHNVNIEDANVAGYGGLSGLVGNNDGTITNCSATGNVSGTGNYIGGLVGQNSGTVSNSYATGNVKGTEDHVGGLVGFNSRTVFNCYATGNVSGTSGVGGLVGYNAHSTVSNCYATGNVRGTNSVGGLVGWNDGMVSNCYATGDVTGFEYVGGFLGQNYYEGKTYNCYATGSVSGSINVGGLVGRNFASVSHCYASGIVSGTYYIGGLMGYNKGTVSNSYATGSVSGSRYVGGLEGQNYYDGKTSNCYATGDVIRSSGTNTDFGGFVGSNYRAKIINCYSIGRVIFKGATNPTDKGFTGIVDTGDNFYEMKGNYWDIETSGQTSTVGIAKGKTTIEMKSRTIYAEADWDIVHVRDHVDEVWYIDEGYDYPRLGWEYYWDIHSPVALAGPDQTVNMGEIAHFNSSLSTDNIGIVSYTWTFTDGIPITLSGMLRSYRFDNAGIFVVTLKVTDAAGNWDTDTMTVTVLDTQAPVANAGADQVISMGETVQFNASLNKDNVGIVSYTWTFTDGTPVILSSMLASYRFDIAGVFVVTLNVTDSAGNWANDTMTVTVLDTQAPVANAGPDQLINMSDTAHFNASLCTDNVGIVNYTWTFTEGVPVTLFGSIQSHWFENAGVFEVTLNVSDATGKWAVDTMTVRVRDTEPPIANAGQDLVIDEGQKITFDAGSSSDNVGIINYSWELSWWKSDDIITIKLYGSQLEYQFNYPGLYGVRLTVVDAAANWATTTVEVTVRDITPPAVNAGSDRRVPIGSTVIIDDSWSWDYVGVVRHSWVFIYDMKERSVEDADFEFVFNKAGTYEIELTVYDASDHTGNDVVVITVVDTGNVTGTVLDPKENPVEGAKVEIRASNGKVNTTTTGPNGSFNIEIIYGDFTWTITKEGYRTISGTGSVDAMGTTILDLSKTPLLKEEGSKGGSMLWLVIPGIVLIIIIVGIGLFFMLRKRGSSKEPGSEVPEDPKVEVEVEVGAQDHIGTRETPVIQAEAQPIIEEHLSTFSSDSLGDVGEMDVSSQPVKEDITPMIDHEGTIYNVINSNGGEER